MKLLVLALTLVHLGCIAQRAPEPRCAPFYSAAVGHMVVAPWCDWIPLVDHDGIIVGCLRLGSR